MQVTLPTKTAGEVELPGGQTVWVQTVNALHREQAREAADLYASREVRPYRKGNEGYLAIQEQFEDGGADVQAEFLANCGYLDGTLHEEADAKFPLADHPVRKEGEKDEAFDKRIAAWDEANAKVAGKRAKHVEGRYEAVKRETASLPEDDRIERCCAATLQRKRREAFGMRFVLEMLARAVRNIEDHSKPMYASADVIADLEDENREALITGYFSLDRVKPIEIPT